MPLLIRRALCLAMLVALTPVAAMAGEDVTVYAAASLTNALTELKKSYERSHDVTIRTSFAGSSTLAKQIEAGAPAQLFASADTQWMDYLQKRGLLKEGSRRDLLGNTLVLVAPKGAPLRLKVEKGADLPGAFTGRVCTGDPASVPVGIYAREALQNLGWWTALEKRLVPTEDVRSALAFVERGECALGIVYDTDARVSDKVVVAGRFPADSHKPVVYPFALLPSATPAAAAFYRYLQGDSAKAVFGKYGFTVLAAKP